MSFWNWVTRRRTDHGWPGYIINGRIRTSTAALILAFFVISWVYNTYRPTAQTPTASETAQVVPPGFMPDPEYTWVPRTNVQTRPRTTSPTTTTSTETTPTTTTTPTQTSGTETSGPAPTTVVDPDGAGPLPPTTVTGTTTTTSVSPSLPVPNRSGSASTTPTTAAVPGLPPAPTTTSPAG